MRKLILLLFSLGSAGVTASAADDSCLEDLRKIAKGIETQKQHIRGEADAWGAVSKVLSSLKENQTSGSSVLEKTIRVTSLEKEGATTVVALLDAMDEMVAKARKDCK